MRVKASGTQKEERWDLKNVPSREIQGVSPKKN